MQKCCVCVQDFTEGSGVEHEMDDGTLYLFCSMEHFKNWVNERRESGKDRF